MKLAMIGVGKLGQDCAEVLAEKHEVVGYDLQFRNPSNFRMTNSIEDAIAGAEFIFVAVPTPHERGYGGELPTSHLEPKDFDYTSLKIVCKEITSHIKLDQTIVIISTVLPGTIRNVIKPILNHEKLLYNPYLIAMGSVKWDMVNPEMIIVGCEKGDIEAQAEGLLRLYAELMQNSPHIAGGTWEEAEAIKIFYNTFISAKIGLVNMILDVAESCGHMNVDIVTSALRDSTQRIMGPRYMHAGMGDAGACHPRDNIALRFLAKKLNLGYDLFESIMTSRERQASNLADRLVTLSRQHKMPIVIHGKAYKPLVSYVDGSYSLLIAHFVEQKGIEVEFVDPLTGDCRSSTGPAVFLLAHNASITYANTGVVPTNAGAYCDFPEGSILLDPWRTMISNNNISVLHYGNTR